MRSIALAMVAFLAAVPAARAQRCEPDTAGSTLESAQHLGPLNTTYVLFDTNCLDPAADPDDLFRFTLAAPGAVNALARATRSGMTLELLDANGVRLKGAQDAADRPIVLGHLLGPGTYYLRLTGVSARTNYTMGVHPTIETSEVNVRAGQSIAWSSIVSFIDVPRIHFDPVPANAGSYFVVDGVVKPVTDEPWSVTGQQYGRLRYVAGAVGSVETVYFRGDAFLWKAARITSVAP